VTEEREYGLRGPVARKVLHQWWWRLLKEDGPDRPPRRGERAILRRCHSLAEVALDKAFNDLLRDLHKKDVQLGRHLQGLAPAARVLMEVREEAPGLTLGKLMARPGKDPKKGAVSGLRFRRLLAIDDLEDLVQALIRVVRLCDEQAPVLPLAADIFDWADPNQREKVRQRWAYDYYANVPDAKDDKAA
jgi:CRISPR system Cascade subunit CasB